MKQKLLALIGVISFTTNTEALQNQNGLDKEWQKLTQQFNLSVQRQREMQRLDTKTPRIPNTEKRSQKKHTEKVYARLTIESIRTETSGQSAHLPQLIEKHFSRNIEQMKFNKFSIDDSETIIKQQELESFTCYYIMLMCTMNDAIINETECLIPAGYTHIASQMMEGNAELLKVKMLSDLRVISQKAFSNCVNLSNVEILGTPNIMFIGDYAFENTNLKKVVLPFGVKHIGSNAFSRCRLLEEIHIPSSVSDIGFNIANDCPNLKDVFVPYHAKISLNKIPLSMLYVVSLKFTDVSEGFYNPIGSFLNLNIHRKNADGSYTNVSIYDNIIAYNKCDMCRNADHRIDCTTSLPSATF